MFLLLLMRLTSASLDSMFGASEKPSSSCGRLGSVRLASLAISSVCISNIYPFSFFWEFLLFIYQTTILLNAIYLELKPTKSISVNQTI